MAALIRILILLLVASPAFAALDKKLVSTNTFALKIVDSAGSPLTGRTLGDIAVHYACAGNTDSVITEGGGDTLTEIDATNAAGYYWIATDDALGCTSEEEVLLWATGTSITPTPRLAKAIINIESDTKTEIGTAGAGLTDLGGMSTGMKAEVQAELVTYDAVVPGDLVSASDVADAVWADQTFCDISAATSGALFTVASCTDHQGNAISLATDSFVGSYLKAYTNGGSDCNVVGEGVFVSDMTSGGVVTVRTADMEGSDYSATPNTSNCGIIVIP